MRCGVMQTEQERLRSTGHALDIVNSPLGEQIGQVARLGTYLVTAPQVLNAVGIAVGKVIDTTAHGPEILLIA